MLYQYKNDKQRIILSVKLRKLCTDVGPRIKQKIACLTHLSATETRNAYTMLRFFMIIAKVKLFYAVTLDWEIMSFLQVFVSVYNLLNRGYTLQYIYVWSGGQVTEREKKR